MRHEGIGSVTVDQLLNVKAPVFLGVDAGREQWCIKQLVDVVGATILEKPSGI